MMKWNRVIQAHVKTTENVFQMEMWIGVNVSDISLEGNDNAANNMQTKSQQNFDLTLCSEQPHFHILFFRFVLFTISDSVH